MKTSLLLSRFLLPLGTLLAVACMSSKNKLDDPSAVKIAGGESISLDAQPWTLKITFPNDPDNFCTATFVSHNTMLTASHCAEEHPVITLSERGNIKSIAVYQYPLDIVSGVIDANDIAVIVFPNDTAKKFATFAARAPKKDDHVTLVGYGSCTEFLGPDDTRGRCSGTNVIKSIGSDSRIVTAATGGVVVSKGDSGGPLFIDGNQIAGVANSGTGAKSYHANLTATENIKWLRSIVSTTNAKICGLDGESCGQSGDNSSQNSTLEAKAHRLTLEFVAKLNSASNCVFQAEDAIELVEDNQRFAFVLNYRLANSGEENQANMNISLTDFEKGKAIFAKLKALGKLETNFSGCSFN